MGADQNLDWRAAAASALEWWRDAGVDVIVGDAAVSWLVPEPAEAAAPIAPRARAARPPADAGALPDTLEAFLAWRVGPHAPEARWGAPPVAPSGPANARIMVLIDCPDREDRTRMLGGAAGRLFDRMLAAIGLTRDDVLIAGVATVRPSTGRVPRDIEARLGEIARHHVMLAAPERLLLLGDAASRAVLSANAAESRERLHILNHKSGTTTDAVASFHPQLLLQKPACKAEAWRDLLMLTRGLK